MSLEEETTDLHIVDQKLHWWLPTSGLTRNSFSHYSLTGLMYWEIFAVWYRSRRMLFLIIFFRKCVVFRPEAGYIEEDGRSLK